MGTVSTFHFRQGIIDELYIGSPFLLFNSRVMWVSYRGVIHLLFQHNFILFLTQPHTQPATHISAVLNVRKTGHFLDPPTYLFCCRNIWMIPYLNRIFKGFSPFYHFCWNTSLHGYQKPTYLHHLLFSFKMANLRQALIYKRHPVASRILNHLVKAFCHF